MRTQYMGDFLSNYFPLLAVLVLNYFRYSFKKWKTCTVFLSSFSINLLVVYRESVNLIGYITRRLSADSQQL